MQQDFSELIKYLDEKFIEVDKRFDGVREDFNILQSAVDGYAKKLILIFKKW